MCGYGGFPEIARLLMEHGADLDNIDVDGDTAEILAMNRGHTDMLVLFDEERLSKQREAPTVRSLFSPPPSFVDLLTMIAHAMIVCLRVLGVRRLRSLTMNSLRCNS
jgi:ankyrin repeat protein